MMAKDPTFDVVSEFDRQELVNALDQTRRDIAARFDLKDANTEIELTEKTLVITTSDDLRLRNVIQVLEEKLAKRGMSPFLLDAETNAPEAALSGRVRQELPLRSGLDSARAKQIVAKIKATKLKVQASIQGDSVRVSGKSRDDLQQVIALLKDAMAEWSYPLQFNNFR
jgi:uncharacterized protein YajQ (UPF0234 family)